jgi:hypothetical protein
VQLLFLGKRLLVVVEVLLRVDVCEPTREGEYIEYSASPNKGGW